MKTSIQLPTTDTAYDIISRLVRNMGLNPKPSLSHDGSVESYQNDIFHITVDWTDNTLQMIEKEVSK